MNKIAAALVKAQREFGPALKDKTNPAFRSKYADLGACIEAVIDALNSNGIALIQKQHPHDGGVMVETIFLHESGETFSAGQLSVPAAKQDPQGYGSALTYARRYSLMAACGIAPEDDDGNAASKPKQQPVKRVLTSPDPNTGDVAWVKDEPTGMSANILADWKQAISEAGPDELEGMIRDGLAAATEVRDREAFVVIREAGKKRTQALAEAA